MEFQNSGDKKLKIFQEEQKGLHTKAQTQDGFSLLISTMAAGKRHVSMMLKDNDLQL